MFTNQVGGSVTPPSILSRRYTSDGYAVAFWDDGAITSPTGVYPLGIGSPRGALTAHGVSALVAQVCGEFTWNQLPAIIRAARSMMARPVPVYPQDIRDVMAGKPDPTRPPKKVPTRPRRCSGCRYTVAGWQLCSHHWQESAA